MLTQEQRRVLGDIEERIETIRRQAEAVISLTQGLETGSAVRPKLEGTITNTAHIKADLALLAASLGD